MAKQLEQSVTPAPAGELPQEVAATLLGSLVGGLLQFASVPTIRGAVRELAENNEAWEQFESLRAQIAAARRG